ncbi:tetratricopeptide repeat protein [Bdellovibrio bacteriovorus]|uniref:tetratricopeptide repeat protein n=1 Tax=Bdellovibrio bacteriovorus TaxID=959 RepID=UPI003AA93858
MSYVLGLLLLLAGSQVFAFPVSSDVAAIEQLQSSLRSNPYENNLRAQLIQKYLDTNQLSQALQEWTSYLKLDPQMKADGAKGLQVQLLLEGQQLKQAKAMSFQILAEPQSSSEDRFRAQVALGDLAFAGFTHGDAASRYGKALQITKSPEVRHRLARAYIKGKRYSKAEDVLSDLIGSGYSPDPVRYDYLLSLLLAGQNEKAAHRLQQWHLEEPGNPWIATAHARLLHSLQQSDLALEVLQHYAGVYQLPSEMQALSLQLQQRQPTSVKDDILPARPAQATNAGVLREGVVAEEVTRRPVSFQAQLGYQLVNNKVAGEGFNSLLSPEAGFSAGIRGEVRAASEERSYVMAARVFEQKYKIPSGLAQDTDRSQGLAMFAGVQQQLTPSGLQLQGGLDLRHRSGIESSTNTYVSGYQMLGLRAELAQTWELRGPWSVAAIGDVTLPVYFAESTAESGQLKWAYYATLQGHVQYRLRDGIVVSAGLGMIRNEFQFKGSGSRGVTDAVDTEDGLTVPVRFAWIY